MELRKINVVENNEVKEYDVLFTFKDEIDNKEFILYTDVNSDIDIYAALYNEKEKRLDYIEDPKDQEMIEKMMEIIKEKI